MSEQPTVTEREAVERERRAYGTGQGAANQWLHHNGHQSAASAHYQGPDWMVLAAARYPLPKVRRLRTADVEVVSTGGNYTMRARYNPEAGRVELHFLDGRWGAIESGRGVTGASIETLWDLKANSWEDVNE